MKNKNELMDHNIQQLINNLDDALKNLPLRVNTYAAYRLKMFAVIADAVYLRNTLEKLLDNWCLRLPFVDETGVDIDWDEVKGKFYPFILYYQPNTTHPLFEEIRNWEEDELNEHIKYSNHSDSIMKMEPLMHWDNIDHYIASDHKFCNDADHLSEESIQKAVKTLTTNDHGEVERLLVYELYRIQLLAENLKAVLRTPSQIISNKDKRDELMAEFFERIKKKYRSRIKRVKDDFFTWYETMQGNMSVELLKQERERYWEEVNHSGFLEYLKKSYHYHGDINNYINLFFDRKGLKESFASFYIYTFQLKYDDWKKKTEQFLIFTTINELITQRMEEQFKKETAQTIAMYISKAPTKDELITRSIRQLMDEKDEKNKGALVKYNNQWIAIHRILSDFYGFSDKYVEFVKQMEDLDLDGIRVPCTLDGVKKVAGILTKNFGQWEMHEKQTNSKKPAFLRQFHVAQRLLKILEALGVEKVEKP